MTVNSKQKGKRYELELAHELTEYGYECRRTAQYCGKTGDASDVVGLPGIHIEAKRQEVLKPYDWIEQAVRDSTGTHNMPAVFFRKNGKKTMVVLRIEDFMSLYKAAQNNKNN